MERIGGQLGALDSSGLGEPPKDSGIFVKPNILGKKKKSEQREGPFKEGGKFPRGDHEIKKTKKPTKERLLK